MIPLPSSPKIISKSKTQAVFEIEGLYPGYGGTLGNSLRRVLLSSLEGVAVTEAKIKGALHEFSTIPGVLEDAVMIILNLKNLRFKIHEGDSHKVQLKVKGEGEVKGSDFKISPQFDLVNPKTHIATITDKKTELEMEIQIERGIGYRPQEYGKTKKSEIGTIAIDAIFTPIKNVSFQVENMRVGERTDFDRLSLAIETDGTITPEEAFFEACNILAKHLEIFLEGKGSLKSKTKEESAEKKDEEGTKIKVEDLKFSKRTLNALLQNEIKTVGGVIKKTEKTLSELEGMGEKAISEIKRKLKKLGLELKQ